MESRRHSLRFERFLFARQFAATVDLVIYPGESHGFGSRLQTRNGQDALARTIAFLRKELAVPRTVYQPRAKCGINRKKGS